MARKSGIVMISPDGLWLEAVRNLVGIGPTDGNSWNVVELFESDWASQNSSGMNWKTGVSKFNKISAFFHHYDWSSLVPDNSLYPLKRQFVWGLINPDINQSNSQALVQVMLLYFREGHKPFHSKIQLDDIW